jgi:hypothetical protein
MMDKGGMGDIYFSKAVFDRDVGALRNEYEDLGLGPITATREARRVLGQQSKSLSQLASRTGTMTMADLPLESSGGAGARMASDTTNDVSN